MCRQSVGYCCVLDGFETSLQKIMDLDMDRVESLTILKDASAKAIYGSKAANGVIVIELKKNPSGDFFPRSAKPPIPATCVR